jgi:hypothetical protein
MIGRRREARQILGVWCRALAMLVFIGKRELVGSLLAFGRLWW